MPGKVDKFMRIAITLGHFSAGGVGTSVGILARGFQDAGHYVEILATDGIRGDDENVTKDPLVLVVLCSEKTRLLKRLSTLFSYLDDFDVVIDNHSLETLLIQPWLSKQIVRLSVVRTTTEGIIEKARTVSKYLDALVAISPEVQRLLKMAAVCCPTVLIPNAIMAVQQGFPRLKPPCRIAYLGRLSDVDKNILLLPKIVRHLQDRGVSFSLEIAGDGPDREKLVQQLKQCGVSTQVTLLGSIPRDNVAGFLNRNAIGLFPSNYEGFGLSVVEAMGAGCVPVASDIPSHRWILGSDADTLLVPVDDASAYADVVISLMECPKQYSQIQERLKSRQAEYFSPQSTIEGYLSLITKVQRTRDLALCNSIGMGTLHDASRAYKSSCWRHWIRLFRGAFASIWMLLVLRRRDAL